MANLLAYLFTQFFKKSLYILVNFFEKYKNKLENKILNTQIILMKGRERFKN